MKYVKHIAHIVMISGFVVQAPVLGQVPEASKILADVRQALGGDNLAALQTLTIVGRSAQLGPDGTIERDIEMNVQLPDKFLRRVVLMAMGNMSVYRLSGFNGPDGLIDEIDQPPQLGHGGAGHGARPGHGVVPADALSPEQAQARRVAALQANKKEYTRLALGLFATAPAVYPLKFTYAGRAQSPDGIAHVIDVTGDDDFKARLFIDTRTHRPLMLSWMDREPSVTPAIGHGGAEAHGSGVRAQGGHGGGSSTDARANEVEANRRVVEFRLFYKDYRPVSGVQIPHRLQSMVDGRVTEELTFDRVLLNRRIDESRFRVSK